MTKIQETLVALPEEKKALFIPAFGNEHVTEPLRRPLAGDPPDSWQGGEVGEFFRVGRL